MKKSRTLLINIICLLIATFLLDLLIKDASHDLITAAEEPAWGYRISNPLSLDQFENVVGSRIYWDELIPDEENTRITIQTAVTDSNTEEPAGWENATNGEAIPGMGRGDLTGFLWTKQILENDDPEIFPSPQLNSLTEEITMKVEGYRTSPEFLLWGEGDEVVKDARIFWQADERFEGDIDVKVNVLSSGAWSYEQDVVNGGQIPGLEPGTSLSEAKIQTKASFIGGPEFYPSLEDIKIFLELE